MSRTVLFILCAMGSLAVACGEPADPDAGPDDAGGIDAPGAACGSAADCDDGAFCNGAEACTPGAAGADARGCVAGTPPCEAGRACDDAAGRCVLCDTPDADGDGHAALDCGGDDCDDTDANRYPGHVEVCDTAMHDEDCDPGTFGFRDQDMDTEPDASCCNAGGACGIDCDDLNPAIGTRAAELCDGLDNDCNGVVDDRTPICSCEPSEPTRPCSSSVGACRQGTDRCVDGTWVCEGGILPVAETCNAIDDDCDGMTDEGGAVLCETPTSHGSCEGNRCVVLSCSAGRGDCDSAAAGCETDLLTDAAHCGGCGLSCRDGARCAAGLCVAMDDVVALAAGRAHACALYASGRVRCWGSNASGQLGIGSASGGSTPVDVPGLSEVREIAAEGDHTCARVASGAVHCWGANGDGQLGDGSTTERRSPTPVGGLSDAIAIAAGGRHSCAVRAGGTVQCWGFGLLGQLGDGGVASSPVPVDTADLTGARGIDAGESHTCAVTASGGVFCWGRNTNGQLGDGSTISRLRPTAVDFPGPDPTIVAIALGTFHSCARSDADALYCWGRGTNGRLGLGTTDQTQPIAAGSAEDVSAGDDHTCVAVGGVVTCFGGNGVGQLGGAGASRFVIRGIGGVIDVAAGTRFSCLARDTGEVFCWGAGEEDQLGDGASSDRGRPASVVSMADAASLATGTGTSCARLGSGQVRCWGSGPLGTLDAEGVYASVPAEGLDDAVAVSVGDAHACAVRASGGVVCWGGDGTGIVESDVPVAIPGITDAVGLAVGGMHACALRRSGAVTCWGSNELGALGDGTMDARSAPVAVLGITDAVELAAGRSHTCARLALGGVRCWGDNERGQLGDSSTTARPTPVDVVGLDDALAIAAGGAHTCAVRASGQAVCWGSNSYGEVGDGTAVDRRVPTVVLGLDSPRSIGLGHDHSCAIAVGGIVPCWGRNEGRYGNGAIAPSATPARAGVPGAAVQVRGGSDQTCALDTLGRSYCWGGNPSYSVGDGVTTTGARLLPVRVSGL